jgi:aspartyl-tRNA(Asn)/glutamyl-tRNA(Gln) amidotransferase subunit A
MFDLFTSTAVARARVRQPLVRAFLSERFDAALVEAAVARPGPLSGVPFGLKDEWETTCLPTTAGSWRHKDRRSRADSPVFEVFRDAGAVLLGKTNMSDLGIAPESTNWVGGATRNPHALKRTAGGSSGGAAAAVADGMVAFDWGTDIGGSIRMPAAFCGVLGMKLSSETWPLTGSFPVIPQVVKWMCGQGPLARTTAQLRALLEIAAPRLRTGQSRSFTASGAAIYAPSHPGVWPEFAAEIGPHLEATFGVAPRLAPSLPPTRETMAIYAGVWASSLEDLVEADDTLSLSRGIASALSAVLFRGRLFNDRRIHPSTAELLTLMALGRLTLFRDRMAARAKAMRVRDAFEALWNEGLVIAAPVTSFPPPVIGRTNLNTHLLESTCPGNLADATGLSIPFGTFSGLPRSIQLLGPPGSERALIDIADRFIASRVKDPPARPVALPS